MKVGKARLAAVVILVAGFLVVGFVPLISYKATFKIPFDITPSGFQICNAKFRNTINSTNEAAYNRCLEQYKWPLVNVTGSSSLAYELLGVGKPPFPNPVFVSETAYNDTFYAILFMSGSRIVAAEQISNDTTFNPPGISISNDSITAGSFGELNATVTFANNSGQPASVGSISIGFPGESGNTTDGSGIVWMSPWYGNFPAYLPCRGNITSGSTCSVTLGGVTSAPRGASLRYSVVVVGRLGDHAFIYRKTFAYTLPVQVIDQNWVNNFIGQVNTARTASLTETSSLDSFASQRFHTAVSQPDISDYGLSQDITTYVGRNNSKSIVEVLLYPGTQDPTSYATSLRADAPGHWSALTNGNYTHFGYYVATGPYELVKLPCPNTEIPRAGINITQFFTSEGCSVSVQQTTWLVIILSN